MTDTGTIGFVGLGNMGVPMVRRISGAGFRLIVFDLRRDAIEALAGEDPKIEGAGSPAEAGARCDVAITMLPDSSVVREVVLGRDGLARGMARGGVIVDMSSSVPTETVRLGKDLREVGIDLVDAPVSGGVLRARDGTLTIMAGGAPEVLAKVEPILAAIGTVHRTGPLGSGHAMKALNNYVSAAGLLAVCEALIIAAKFGLDPHVLNGVLNVSTGRNNTTDKKVEPFILNRAFDSGFALDLMRKDVGIAHDLAEALALDAPWLAACEGLLEEAARTLGPGVDHTAAFAFLEARLGGGAKTRGGA